MSSFAIQVQNLGKEYIIGGAEQHHESFREMLISSLSSPLRKLRKLGGQTAADERFWALQNISFDVYHGDIVGIIGRNGAGKSTLLKILSRITQPTEGRVVTYGRVASLLEVGTGFHPELTGRENIFLNGAILGMSRNEIESKFDEIVAFAEVEKFLDTPVKRYSSGMYVRLAFAVAAHLEPEILLVDEVLAVGDNEFQKKCLGKMSEVAGEGRTVLFVSHNMAAISGLCSRAILLDEGRVSCDGEVETAFETYFGSDNKKAIGWESDRNSPETANQFLHAAALYDKRGEPSQSISYEDKAAVRIRFISPRQDDQYKLVVRFTNMMGVHVFASWDTDCQPLKKTLVGKEYMAECKIPAEFLKPGNYSVTVSLITKAHGNPEEVETGEFDIEVTARGFGQGLNRWGVVAPKLQWRTLPID